MLWITLAIPRSNKGSESESSFPIHLLPEDKMYFIPGRKSRKPEVDYIISIEGQTIKTHIPVETKQKLEVVHMKQVDHT